MIYDLLQQGAYGNVNFNWNYNVSGMIYEDFLQRPQEERRIQENQYINLLQIDLSAFIRGLPDTMLSNKFWFGIKQSDLESKKFENVILSYDE